MARMEAALASMKPHIEAVVKGQARLLQAQATQAAQAAQQQQAIQYQATQQQSRKPAVGGIAPTPAVIAKPSTFVPSAAQALPPPEERSGDCAASQTIAGSEAQAATTENRERSGSPTANGPGDSPLRQRRQMGDLFVRTAPKPGAAA